MDELFGVYFMQAMRDIRAEAKRDENRKRRRKMSAESNARNAVVCSMCRTYGGTMKKFGSGYICRKCGKERKNETRNDG